jgi:hypothetical protein
LPNRAASAQDISSSVPRKELRNQKDWNPEWSRRSRGFPIYAAIRPLGRSGIGAKTELKLMSAGLGGAFMSDMKIHNLLRYGAAIDRSLREMYRMLRELQHKRSQLPSGAPITDVEPE